MLLITFSDGWENYIDLKNASEIKHVRGLVPGALVVACMTISMRLVNGEVWGEKHIPYPRDKILPNDVLLYVGDFKTPRGREYIRFFYQNGFVNVSLDEELWFEIVI